MDEIEGTGAASLHEGFLDQILPLVNKPARYINREWNSVHKDHREVEVKFAFAFPDVYEVGMSHLGLKIIYHELNRRQDTVAERVFAPWGDMEALLREKALPLFALESRSPLAGFDIIGFTLQYEMSYTNILNMLDLAGVPLLAAERGADDPLVVGGGPCAFNPEPLAGFFDALVLGEGEEVVHELVDVFKAWKRTGRPEGRDGLLERLASVPGIYVPSFYRVDYLPDGRVGKVTPLRPGVPPTVRRRVVKDLDKLDFPTRLVVPFMDVVHDRVMLEVFRGCTRGCRFCQAGMIYRPVRERSPEEILRLAEDSLRHTGYREISLASLSTADYSCIEDTVEKLVDRYGREGVGVSLPSLRVDSFSVRLAEQVQRVRKTGLTFAPEAGSERLRRVINKGVTEDDLLNTVRQAFSTGWEAVKLYFMIGLPTEDYGDLDGIAELVGKVLAAGREARGGKRVRVTVSASSFVPKPHTPFQWEPQLPVQELRARQDYLRRRLNRPGVVFDWHDSQLSFLEAVFSRGDRRLGAVLLEAWRLGCKFDAWSEEFRFYRWEEAFARTGLDPAFYANRRREPDEVFPWDHLDSGVTREFLEEEYRRALAGEGTPDCRMDYCTMCGACPGLGVRVKLAAPPLPPAGR